jgi:mRNA interferase MazF
MAQGKQVAHPRRGEIYLADSRPALIIQNDIGNRYSALTIIAAITSKISPILYPVEVIVKPSSANGLKVLSAILLDQVQTVDRQSLIKRMGVLDPPTMRRVDEAIQISLGLLEI